jgi:hypothetical protein
MINSVRDVENDVNMYAKIRDFNFYVLLYINTPIFDLYEFSKIY